MASDQIFPVAGPRLARERRRRGVDERSAVAFAEEGVGQPEARCAARRTCAQSVLVRA